MIKQIIEGTFNNMMGLQEELSQSRMKICRKCPLYSKSLGGKCNNKLWLNTETGEVSSTSRKGFIRGCGCILQSKTRSASAHCPASKW